MTLLTISVCFLSLSFLLLSHPLSLGMILLLQTIMIAMITGHMYLNFWFSYLLFLIMVGGMLVMFIYMTSIAANEKFETPQKFYMTILLTLMMCTIMLSKENLMILLNSNLSLIESAPHLTMNKFFSSTKNILMMALMSYMFLSLMVVVNMSEKNKGPLRQL
uniref:NADH-ubiquinone oxidoreductase chain 6 n=2 Tax=Scolytinae TaxID=55867 RepID=A0A7G7CEN1_9CUCU|nr:NADH dehydrogenase subunit 6 [Trypophloeus asperatus]AOY40108.1 NADH dehydrogenase subunit 6 [Trypophloeus asperatus]QNE86047.1 NADH dehydrogenase subunit 6 [Cryphalus abietis]